MPVRSMPAGSRRSTRNARTTKTRHRLTTAVNHLGPRKIEALLNGTALFASACMIQAQREDCPPRDSLDWRALAAASTTLVKEIAREACTAADRRHTTVRPRGVLVALHPAA